MLDETCHKRNVTFVNLKKLAFVGEIFIIEQKKTLWEIPTSFKKSGFFLFKFKQRETLFSTYKNSAR